MSDSRVIRRVLPAVFLTAVVAGCAATGPAGDEWSGWYAEDRLLGEADWYDSAYGYADSGDDTGAPEISGYYPEAEPAAPSGYDYDYHTRDWFEEKSGFEKWYRKEPPPVVPWAEYWWGEY